MAVSQLPSWNLVDDKGTWSVRVRIVDEGTGAVYHKSKSTGMKVKDNTKRAALKMADKIVEDILDQYKRQAARAEEMRLSTFEEYVDAWLAARELSVRPNTAKSYWDYATSHVIPALGKYRIEAINWRILQAFADKMLKKYNRSTVKKYFIIIRGALDDAMRDGVIQSNPALLVRLPKAERTNVSSALTKNEANQFLIAAEDVGEPLRSAIVLGLCYGLRRSEVCGLRWIDINFKDGTMHIQHTVTQNGTVLLDEDHTKTQRSNRTLTLISNTVPYLKQLRAAQIRSGLVLDKVVVWPDGRIMRPDGITRMFSTFIRQKGLRKIRFHDLRHTAATLLADAGLSPKKLQAYLGHDSVDMTLNLYTHVVDTEAREASQKMDEIIFSGFCSEICSEKASEMKMG